MNLIQYLQRFYKVWGKKGTILSIKLRKQSYGIVMMLGHLCCDINSGALPAILPFLMVQKGISYSAAAGLTFALSSIGSVIQPVFGNMADKHSRPWMMSAGIMMAGCGVSMLGFLNSYWAMFIAVTLTGIGGALFHPDGGRMANYVAGERKGRGMSNFSVGGNMGGAVGPMLVVLGINLFGMHGTAILAVPSFLMAAFLFMQSRDLAAFAQEGSNATAKAMAAGQRDDWRSFTKLTGVVFLRSTISVGMTTFIPLFWLEILLQSENVSSSTTTIIAVAGALSTLIGGRLADRLGFNRVIRTGLIFVGPCLAIVALSRSVWFSTFMLIPLAMTLNLAFSPSVALGQKLVPNHIGLASGITMGLASSFGGVVSPLLGKVADSTGSPLVVLWILAGIAVVACVGSFFVPDAPPAVQQQPESCSTNARAAS